MFSRNVLYSGRDDPPPQRIPLRAGPLTLLYEQGDLRYLRLGEVEILRRVYVAVRDCNWGTVPPQFSNVQMDIGSDSFRITYDVVNCQNEIDFFWQGRITGDAQGTLTFRMEGVARSTFMRNRIGLCVLHPASAAGAACVVTHVDGTCERATLPELISPEQPVRPFAEMRALAHEVAPGVWAELEFSGDVFEMEDQRNWTDASFKTFCPPLNLPYPVEMPSGARVTQSLTLTLKHTRPLVIERLPPTVALSTTAPVILSFDAARSTPLPHIGLGIASHGQALTEREVARLQLLHLHHLRVDLTPAEPGWPARLEHAARQAGDLDASLEIALSLSDQAESELQHVARVCRDLRPRVSTWLVYPAKEIFTGGSPTERVVSAARQALGGSARLGAGTNTDFIFQRTPPPTALLDCVCLALNPQVHAFDDLSLIETLATQATVVNSARRWADGLPIVVSPVTLKPRHNPYATGAIPPAPPGELPPQVDPRQMSLLAAGWTLGSLKYLAESGAHSVTYFETTGWRGVMETARGSPMPEEFRSLPGVVFPLYHVLADVGEFAGGEVVSSTSSDPLHGEGLVLRKDGRTRVLLANLTAEPQRVTVRLGPSARVRRLDETSAMQAMQAPEEFRAHAGELVCAADGTLTFDLLPYAVIRVDAV